MSIEAGTHRFGPDNATLSVHTGRSGAAAKAGHDLVMHVTAWEATLEVGEAPAATSMELSADATSLRVQKGTGGVQALGDEDKANIHQTIDDEVLKREAIEFRSTSVERDGGRMSVEGELTILRTTRPVAFELNVADDGSVERQGRRHPERLGHEALFGAVRGAQGEGRRRGCP